MHIIDAYFAIVKDVKDILGKIALLIATGILLLHSLLPHEHESPSLSTLQYHSCAQSADTWVDLIRHAFHANPGDNHLEEFTVAFSYFFSGTIPDAIVIHYEQLITAKPIPASSCLSIDEVFHDPPNLRGPPLFV
ncbi:MAG: hypothetical protein JXQ90_01270 [Cyclobacteriaceae bacterium]